MAGTLKGKENLGSIRFMSRETYDLQEHKAGDLYAVEASYEEAINNIEDKLESIEKDGVAAKITVDNALSSTSENPVQNKVIKTALDGKSSTGHKHTKSEITDFPTIPSTSDCVKFVSNANVNVVGTNKTVAKLSPETVYVPNGLIMGGSAQAAGLVTRGICGVGSPTATGAATKDCLFVNYDGSNTYNAGRQLVIQAGEVGTHYGNNLYQYTAARGDAVKAYVDNAVSGKQASLSEAQLNAANSGITATKVSTYDGYASAISSKANASDVYTKTEVDNKVASVFKYKGSKSKYSDLPTTGNVTGDVWNIESANTNPKINAGDNVAWNGSAWDVLAGTVDLSNYATKDSVPSAVTETTVSGWGFTKNTGTYSKPSGGIPKTDLASAVQTSLGKADTALQSFTETDPTVPSHVKGITQADITNWNGKTSNTGTVTSVNNVAPVNGNVSITIPTVNNATLTIQKNGTNVTTFTANASSNATANIIVPTKVSELTNDSNFTANTGTITEIKMNGASKGTSGSVDLGTVITSHQSLDGCVKTTGAQTVAGSKTFSDNAKFTGTNLTLQHQTEANVTQASANPKITFNNVDASQSASLIYNDFDSYEGSDSITMVSNQANPYFIAPHLRATNALHLGAVKTGPSIKYNTTEQAIEFVFA